MNPTDHPTPLTDAEADCSTFYESWGECAEAVHADLARDLERKLAMCREALETVKEWHDRDGSVGGCDSMIEDVVNSALAATEIRKPS